MAALFFYLFSGLLLLSATMVILARNPVHSVLFLILSFCNAAGLFILLGAEFLGFILIVVYVGAVAVLFLFVVMMLDVEGSALKETAKNYLPMAGAVIAVLAGEFFLILKEWPATIIPPAKEGSTLTNTHALGAILYTDYFLIFQMAGLILLVAIIGTITLTLRRRSGVKHQEISAQINRQAKDVIEICKIPPSDGGSSWSH